MSEIEKLYEKCNIEPEKKGYCDWDGKCVYPCEDECPYWKYEDEAKYPPFTAEKQIELIKWLAKKGIYIYDIAHEYNFVLCEDVTDFGSKIFEEALSGVINNLWQDLTEGERKQVKGILE